MTCGAGSRAATSRTSATSSTPGTAAVIGLAESKLEEQLDEAVTRSNMLIEKQIDANADKLKSAIDAAARADAG